MQAGLNPRMARPLDSLAARLKAARTQCGVTQGRLAELVGLNQSDISKLERGSMRSTTAIARLAHALGTDAEWLELGDGIAPAWAHALDGPVFPSADQHPPQLSAEIAKARQVSQSAVKIAPNVMTTDGVAAAMLAGNLPNLFTMPLPDAAVGAAGTAVLWAKDWPAKPGQWILIRDRHGQLHVRLYGQGKRPGQWVAYSDSSAFANFSSDEDAIELLATRVGLFDESIASLQQLIQLT